MAEAIEDGDGNVQWHELLPCMLPLLRGLRVRFEDCTLSHCLLHLLISPARGPEKGKVTMISAASKRTAIPTPFPQA